MAIVTLPDGTKVDTSQLPEGGSAGTEAGTVRQGAGDYTVEIVGGQDIRVNDRLYSGPGSENRRTIVETPSGEVVGIQREGVAPRFAPRPEDPRESLEYRSAAQAARNELVGVGRPSPQIQGFVGETGGSVTRSDMAYDRELERRRSTERMNAPRVFEASAELPGGYEGAMSRVARRLDLISQRNPSNVPARELFYAAEAVRTKEQVADYAATGLMAFSAGGLASLAFPPAAVGVAGAVAGAVALPKFVSGVRAGGRERYETFFSASSGFAGGVAGSRFGASVRNLPSSYRFLNQEKLSDMSRAFDSYRSGQVYDTYYMRGADQQARLSMKPVLSGNPLRGAGEPVVVRGASGEPLVTTPKYFSDQYTRLIASRPPPFQSKLSGPRWRAVAYPKPGVPKSVQTVIGVEEGGSFALFVGRKGGASFGARGPLADLVFDDQVFYRWARRTFGSEKSPVSRRSETGQIGVPVSSLVFSPVGELERKRSVSGPVLLSNLVPQTTAQGFGVARLLRQPSAQSPATSPSSVVGVGVAAEEDVVSGQEPAIGSRGVSEVPADLFPGRPGKSVIEPKFPEAPKPFSPGFPEVSVLPRTVIVPQPKPTKNFIGRSYSPSLLGLSVNVPEPPNLDKLVFSGVGVRPLFSSKKSGKRRKR